VPSATTETRRRLPPEIFDLPVEKMRKGYYTDAYFNHARETLLADGRRPRVLMQIFQRNHAYLGGMDEAIAILKLCSEDWDALTVHHAEIGELVRELGVQVIAVGELARSYGGEWVATAPEAAARLRDELRPGDAVLVKGSRSVGLEVVAENLLN